ncbi:MAG: hypothetical protein M5U34_27345 [Chloroflexi bacterium]|nr:hypothetical protein [Chloroflexota bacterium]
MRKSTYESAPMQPLLALLHDDRFKTAVAALPGYDTTPMGQVQFINQA